tara:strand:- start:571 stop:924 length:354 start_codon:yes stop_codon:yes gene_type:complete
MLFLKVSPPMPWERRPPMRRSTVIPSIRTVKIVDKSYRDHSATVVASTASLPSESWGGYVTFFCNLWLVVYPFIMLNHMFSNSWILTVTKTLMLSFAYMMPLVTAFTLAAVLLVIAL